MTDAPDCHGETKPADIDERVLGADPNRPRPPKRFASRFWGALRASFGKLDRRPRWLWSWLWEREFDALMSDAAVMTPGKTRGRR